MSSFFKYHQNVNENLKYKSKIQALTFMVQPAEITNGATYFGS